MFDDAGEVHGGEMGDETTIDAAHDREEAPGIADGDEEFEDQGDGFDEGELRARFDESFGGKPLNRSLADLKRLRDEGELILDPEWQRNYVWTNRQASRLIESFLLNIPIPLIYLAKTHDGEYEVLDGLQRLTSVFNFFDNKFKLVGLGMQAELNGKKFRDLDRRTQRELKNSFLSSFELPSNANTDMHFVVFERLNTGGTKLNEMEIRNCLYRGRLNDLIKELATDEDFIRCVNEKTLSRRMKDRTFVLRFLAFYERTHGKCRNGLKKFLNEFLDTYRNPRDDKLREYREVFKRCMKASQTVFGNDGFRLKKEKTGTSRSLGEWSTRANVAIFQCVATSFASHPLGEITKNADSIREEYLDLISEDDKWMDYVRRATGEVSRLDYVFETWRRRLGEVLRNDGTGGQGNRLFSRQLKKELFDQSPTCTICGNAIRLLDDAVVDHVEHYWRGGKTLPENARLAHRYCNLERGGR